MRILFDHSVPAPLFPFLTNHSITEARARGWNTLSNGDLLGAAENAGFEILLTADKNKQYQQNLAGRKIAPVVLSSPQWPVVQLHTEKVLSALDRATPCSYIEVLLA